MINYFVQTIIYQAIFLMVYEIFLQKETYFKSNRIYLIASSILSLIIPLIQFKGIQENISTAYVVYLPEVILNPESIVQPANATNSEINYLIIIFWTGLIISSLLFIIKLGSIFKLILTNKVKKEGQYNLIILDNNQSVFSFFNYIFVTKNLLKNNKLEIIQHELIHVKQKHSIDLLWFELVKIVQWFNPFIYIYQKRISLLHEYLADEVVLKNKNADKYLKALLSETFNIKNISFINQFYKHSLIKKRIVMITKKKSQSISKLKYLVVIPILLIMLILSAFQNKSIGIYTNTYFKKTDSINQERVINFSEVDKVPVYPGCKGTESELKACFQEKISEFVNNNINMDMADQLNLPDGIKRIFVLFTINSSGKVVNIKVRAPHKKLEEETIRVIKSLPEMKPAIFKGERVGVKYSLPIAIMIGTNKNNDNLFVQKNKFEINAVPFSKIDEVPIYPGCRGNQAALRKCLKENITQFVGANFNADLANNLGLSTGVKRIFVLFKIDKDGNITGVRARAPHVKLEEEAIRVIKSLPQMIPGKQKGENVAVKYSLPIAINVE